MDIVLDLRKSRHEPLPQVAVSLHQAQALLAAQRVVHGFTRAGKAQAKRECLAHLRASLLSPKEGGHVAS